ncbi:hypothetical protein [Streptomyces zagrosensis]|uniref:Uncharacterized protein n=1 Tax=Streptomyces zagrosensis TaxID=1042984 RepID=A0A7W9QCR0_9ACTN|nr:hypothetical protein [Streptomyces zagrosensis]MBB5936792.1 hypothetical protein [Streptomyces zagrosensis]
MPIEPIDPETFHHDEPAAPTEPADGASGERNVEAPEADTAEQRTGIAPDSHSDEQPNDLDLTTANPADVAEQYRIVETDEDDYR